MEESKEENDRFVQLHAIVDNLKEVLEQNVSKFERFASVESQLKAEVEVVRRRNETLNDEVRSQLSCIRNDICLLQKKVQFFENTQNVFQQQLENIQTQQTALVDELKFRGIFNNSFPVTVSAARPRHRFSHQSTDSGMVSQKDTDSNEITPNSNWSSSGNPTFSSSCMVPSIGIGRTHLPNLLTSKKSPIFEHMSNGTRLTDQSTSQFGNKFCSDEKDPRIENNAENNFSDSGSDCSAVEVANRSLDISKVLIETPDILGVTASDDETDDLQQDDHRERSEIKVLPISKKTSSRSSPVKSMSKSSEMRFNIVRELLETEKRYVSTLAKVVDDFAMPIHESGILSDEEMNAMFPTSLTLLHSLHSRLCQKLQYRLINWSNKDAVGDIFSMLMDKTRSDLMIIYSQYVDDYPQIVLSVRRWCKHSKKFRKLLKDCSQSSSVLDLNSCLITPIQRVPRYVLFLQRLSKHTAVGHSDSFLLDACLSRLAEFLEELNSSIQTSVSIVDKHSSRTSVLSRRSSSIYSSSHHAFRHDNPRFARKNRESVEFSDESEADPTDFIIKHTFTNDGHSNGYDNLSFEKSHGKSESSNMFSLSAIPGYRPKSETANTVWNGDRSHATPHTAPTKCLPNNRFASLAVKYKSSNIMEEDVLLSAPVEKSSLNNQVQNNYNRKTPDRFSSSDNAAIAESYVPSAFNKQSVTRKSQKLGANQNKLNDTGYRTPLAHDNTRRFNSRFIISNDLYNELPEANTISKQKTSAKLRDSSRYNSEAITQFHKNNLKLENKENESPYFEPVHHRYGWGEEKKAESILAKFPTGTEKPPKVRRRRKLAKNPHPQNAPDQSEHQQLRVLANLRRLSNALISTPSNANSEDILKKNRYSDSVLEKKVNLSNEHQTSSLRPHYNVDNFDVNSINGKNILEEHSTRPSFKKSLKKIFSKKQHSRIIELTPNSSKINYHSNNHHKGDEVHEHNVDKFLLPVNKQKLFASSVNKLETYEDENGDPCSAV